MSLWEENPLGPRSTLLPGREGIILFLNHEYVISAHRLNHLHNPSDSDTTGKQHPLSMAKEAYPTLMERELGSPKA